MIIKKINLCGLDKVFEGYRDSANSGRTGFTTQLFKFLNHAMISIVLDNVTGIELYFLKAYASEIYIIDQKYSAINDKTDNIDVLSQDLVTLVDEISNDSDIHDSFDDIAHIILIGSQQSRVIAVFRGTAICSITGTFTDPLFKHGNQYDDVYDYHVVAERVALLFHKSFYEYAYNKISEFDLTTEFMLNKKYYQYADDICTLADVTTPHGEISFFGNDSSGLQSQIDSIKASMKIMPFIFDRTSYLTFVIKSTFKTFLDLYTHTRYVNDHENLKVVFKKPEAYTGPETWRKYKTRINETCEKITSIIEKKDSMVSMKELNLIFMGSPITYTIQIPVSDIPELDLSIFYPTTQAGSELTAITNKIKSVYNDAVKPLIS